MPNTFYQTGGKLAVKFDRTSTTPEFTPGEVAIGNGGKSWIYVGPLTGGAIAANATCTVTPATGAVTNVGGGWTNPVAMAVGDYAWVYKTTSVF